MTSKAKEVLQGAADLIERVGWTRGNYTEHDEEGNVCGYCAVGAIRAVAEGDFTAENEVYNTLADFLGRHEAIPIWNDAPERTKEEVISKLREAAGTLDG